MLFRTLWKPTKSRWVLFLPLGAFLSAAVGAVILFAAERTLHFTSENVFCYSCHIGMDTIVEEYQRSVHFTNETGVQASCADCHIPKEFIPMMRVKIAALEDVYHKVVGTITLENFEEHRFELAEPIWHELEENDSKPCRQCHLVENWNLADQSEKAQIQHDFEFWQTENKTCISCHKGVAHFMPFHPGSLTGKSILNISANSNTQTD